MLIVMLPLMVYIAGGVLLLVGLVIYEAWAGIYWGIRRLLTGEKIEESDTDVPSIVFRMGQ